MNRETKEIVAGDHKVVVKTYITGREANAIKQELYGALKLDVAGGTVNSKELSGEFLIKQEKKLIETIVVSIDGVTEGIHEKLLDMRNDDYQKIVAGINEVYNGNLVPAK